MNSVEKYIFENYRALVENAGFSVYYVEFQKSHKDSILRLYIEPKDADQTMDIDACEVAPAAMPLTQIQSSRSLMRTFSKYLLQG